MRELHLQMQLQNEETAEILKQNGHPNIDQAVRMFQIKFIYDKMNKLIPWLQMIYKHYFVAPF